MAGGKKTRCRGEKDPDALAERLMPLAEKTKSFVKYHDCAKFEDLPGLQRKLVMANSDVVTAAKTASISKSVAEAPLELIANNLQQKWGMDDKTKQDYVKVMACRLRNLIHDVEKARRNGAQWAVSLEAGESGSVKLESPTDVPVESPSKSGNWRGRGHNESEEGDSTMEYGYDEEIMVGWRAPPNAGKEQRVFSLSIKDDSTAQDDEGVMLEFDDGEEHRLETYTYGMLRARKGSAPGKAWLWESVHSVTHHRIAVCQRLHQDILLLCVMEQNRQLSQIRLDTFGEVPEPQPRQLDATHPTVLAAIRFFELLLGNYCIGELKDKFEFQRARDEKLAELGLCRPGKGQGKKSGTPGAGVRGSELVKQKDTTDTTIREPPVLPVSKRHCARRVAVAEEMEKIIKRRTEAAEEWNLE